MRKFSVILLSAALLSLGAAVSPNVAQAFDATQPAGAATISQAPPAPGAPAPPPRGFAALNLSDAQKTQFKSMNDASESKIRALLSADQQTRLSADLAAGPSMAPNNAAAGPGPRHPGNPFMHALRSLDLSDQQHQQIRAIEKDQHAQMLAILTPDQAAQLKSMMTRRGPPGASPQPQR